MLKTQNSQELERSAAISTDRNKNKKIERRPGIQHQPRKSEERGQPKKTFRVDNPCTRRRIDDAQERLSGNSL